MARAKRAIFTERIDVNRASGPIWLLVAWLGGVGVLALQTAVAQSISAPASRPAGSSANVDVTRLLRDLSHPGFKTRSEALAMLCELPANQLGPLVETYRTEGSHEVRLGLRAAIEHAFYRKELEGRMGFLGLEPWFESQIYDPLTGRVVEAILIRRVLPGFPAEAAGIKNGDMVLDFEGKATGELAVAAGARPAAARQMNAGALRLAVPGVAQIKAFTTEVSRREPGSQVRLRLLRCRPKDRELLVTFPAEPVRTLEGADLLAVSLPYVQAPLSLAVRPTMRYGLCFTNVAANSVAAALGLQAGDVIVAVGRMPLSPNITPDQLTELFGQAAPGDQVSFTLSRVEQVNLNVTLGGRPVDKMNPEDMEIAQARFAEWWKTQTGEASLRSPAGVGFFSGIPRSGTALPDSTLLP